MQPVIGVLCIDISLKLAKNLEKHYESYLPASYVKFLESAGALVVPLWINRPHDYYKSMMSKLNGVLIPGGAVFFNNSENSPEMTNYCVESSRHIYNIAAEMNKNGLIFPLWGTCLGFQLILLHSCENGKDPRQRCTEMNCALPLELTEDYSSSTLFGNLPIDIKHALETENFGWHRHRYCITRDMMQDCDIEKDWKVLATNKTSDAVEFVTVVEHKRYPFFGWQVHLEHACHEFIGEIDTYDHNAKNIKASQYFGNLFVNECRKNETKVSCNEIKRFLIWNLTPKSTMNMNVYWKECYLFPHDVDYPL